MKRRRQLRQAASNKLDSGEREMPSQPKIVFKMTDVPYLKSPDTTMRDQVMVTEDTCGARQYTAGFGACLS